jgi:hypothetical protein
MFGERETERPCPPVIDLVRFEAGDLDELRAAAVNGHQRRCRPCAGRIRDLRQARSELFENAPAQRSRQAAADIASVMRPPPPSGLRRLALPLLLVPAAGLAAALALLPVREHTPVSAAAPAFGHARPKGGTFAVRMTCSRGGRIIVPGPDTALAPGDRLRFAYTTAEPGYLAIFGVERDGDIFPYYPERDLRGLRVAPGAGVLLPDSIELDDNRGDERIFALWSPRPLDDAGLRAAVASALVAAAGDVRRLGNLPGSTASGQLSFLIRRE